MARTTLSRLQKAVLDAMSIGCWYSEYELDPHGTIATLRALRNKGYIEWKTKGRGLGYMHFKRIK